MKTEPMERRNETTVREFEMENVESTDYPGNYADTFEDDAWNFDRFIENFQVKIIRSEGNELEFDLIGISPAIANAFRRILLAEVPTVAIEKVEVYNNTSIFQDDFLAHRLGLIPLRIDPRLFNFPKTEEYQYAVSDPSKEDQIVFELKQRCKKGKNSEDAANRNVYSKAIHWAPENEQQRSKFADQQPEPVNDDILIAKLSPGQELDLRLVCVKGIGRDHAKFSPVCTASYRLLPKIELLRDVTGEDAELIKESFSPGVIELIEVKEGRKKTGLKKAVVADARKDMCSRNVFRHEHLKDAVRMGLVKDHFIFTIESTGALPPNVLLKQAIDILIEKCDHFIEELADVKRV